MCAFQAAVHTFPSRRAILSLENSLDCGRSSKPWPKEVVHGAAARVVVVLDTHRLSPLYGIFGQIVLYCSSLQDVAHNIESDTQ